MQVGSLVKLKKDNWHNRNYLGFEHMFGIIVSMSDRHVYGKVASVWWNDSRFKITEWRTTQLTSVQNLNLEM